MSIVYRQNTPLSIGVDVTVDVKSGTYWRTSLIYLVEFNHQYNP
jgi:hypothetical protein